MPTLSEIRSDPNYVNANAETKAAIFNKWSASDPNYSNANEETKAAIREKFGVSSGKGMITEQTPRSEEPSMLTNMAAKVLTKRSELKNKGAEGFLRGFVGEAANLATNAANLTRYLNPWSTGEDITRSQQAIKEFKEGGKGLPLYDMGSVSADIAGTSGLPIKGSGGILERAAQGATGGYLTGYLTGGEEGGETGATVGAGVNVVLPPLLEHGVKSAGWLVDAVKGRLSDVRAGRVIRDVGGDKLDDIVAAIQASKDPNLSAAQAAVDAGSTRFSALGARTAEQQSEWAQGLKDAQEAGRAEALASVKPDLAASEAARKAATDPMYATARQSNAVVNTRNVVKNINDVLTRNPGNKELVTALTDIKNGLYDAKGKLRTNPEQVMSVVDGVKAKLANKDNKFIVEQLVNVKDELKKTVPGMEIADLVFRQKSVPVNQSKVITELEDVLTNYKGGERVQPFLNALGRGEEALLKRSTGAPRYQTGDMSKVMSPQQMDAIGKVESELVRDTRLSELASSGRKEVAEVLTQDAFKYKLPNLLNRYIAMGNKGIDVAEDLLNKATMDRVYEAMKTGKTALEAIDTLPTSEKNKVMQAIIKSRGGQNYLIAPSVVATQGEQK